MARKKTESPPTEPDFPEGTKGPPGLPPSKLMETAGENPDDKKPMPDPARHTALLKRMENDFKYHAPKEGQPKQYEAIRAMGHQFALLLAGSCPDGRELSTALTKIEEAVFWGNAAIARS